MENGTIYLYFNFTIFMRIGPYRYAAFAFVLLLYSFIVFANSVIILVILRENTLHQPMYIFIAFLSLNSLYGSAGFFPRFLTDLLSDTHLISVPACFTQIYIIYTFAFYELTFLSVMAYDRYVAVCHPLHYHRKMNSKTVSMLIFLALVCPACNLAASVTITVRVPLCGNKIHKVYCATWNVVKLLCFPATVNNIAALLGAIVTAFVPFSFIMYTYLRIILACWKTPRKVRGKVLQSCVPHVFSFAVYSLTSFSDTVLSRRDLKGVNPFAAIILSMGFIVLPPLLNPLVYGLKLPEVKRNILTLFMLNRNSQTHPKSPDTSSDCFRSEKPDK